MDVTSLEYQMMLFLLGFSAAVAFVFLLLAGQGGDRQAQQPVRPQRYRRDDHEPRAEVGGGCEPILIIVLLLITLLCVTIAFG